MLNVQTMMNGHLCYFHLQLYTDHIFHLKDATSYKIHPKISKVVVWI